MLSIKQMVLAEWKEGAVPGYRGAMPSFTAVNQGLAPEVKDLKKGFNLAWVRPSGRGRRVINPAGFLWCSEIHGARRVLT